MPHVCIYVYTCGLHVGLIIYCLVFRWCLENYVMFMFNVFVLHIFGMFMDKVELISNEALTHRIADPSWWFGFGTCGNAGTVVFNRCHKSKLPWISWCFCSPPCFDAGFFVVLQNQGGSLYITFKFQCHWVEKDVGINVSFQGSFFRPFCTLPKRRGISRDLPPWDEVSWRKNVSHRSQPGFSGVVSFGGIEWRRVVTDIAIAIVCHQKLWDSRVLDVKTTQDETSI